MCDRSRSVALIRRQIEGEPYALALLQEGPWYMGALPPTGYKWMRRVPHSAQGPRVGNIGNARTNVTAMHGNTLSLGARFRRQPLAPEGATLTGKRGLTAQRGQAEGAAIAMNTEMRSLAQ